jgi:hypothetical protein
MNIKTSVIDLLTEVQKDSEDVSTGKFFIRYIRIFQEFDIKVGEVKFDLPRYN